MVPKPPESERLMCLFPAPSLEHGNLQLFLGSIPVPSAEAQVSPLSPSAWGQPQGRWEAAPHQGVNQQHSAHLTRPDWLPRHQEMACVSLH